MARKNETNGNAKEGGTRRNAYLELTRLGIEAGIIVDSGLEADTKAITKTLYAILAKEKNGEESINLQDFCRVFIGVQSGYLEESDWLNSYEMGFLAGVLTKGEWEFIEDGEIPWDLWDKVWKRGEEEKRQC